MFLPFEAFPSSILRWGSNFFELIFQYGHDGDFRFSTQNWIVFQFSLVIVKVVMFDKGELEPVLGGVYSYTDAASLRLVTQNSV